MNVFLPRFSIACGVVGLAMVSLAPSVSAQTGRKATPNASAPAGGKDPFRVIQWEELIPKDWDPFKPLRDAKLGSLSDADPRAVAMLKQMQEAWDQAPTNKAMEGASIKLPGYLVPLEETAGVIKEFLLVPYYGACIHTPPPPANQIIHVVPSLPLLGMHTMQAVWVRGTIKTSRDDTTMGTSGYRMDGVTVEPFIPPGVSPLRR